MSKVKRLYVLRHGNAQLYGYDRDEFRELTNTGIQEVIWTAQKFKEKGERFDAVFVSPYIRAQQTAEHFLSVLETDITPRTSNIITPSGKEIEVALWLNDQKADSILLITHQPFAHQLVDLLVDEPLPARFSMATGTLAALEGEFFATACCQYRWSLSP